MANPSLKNGHTSIANELIEQLALRNIPGEEMRILWVVIRHTWGWIKGDRRKDWDHIAISTFAKETGMKRGNVVRVTARVVAKRLLLETESGYKLNQDYEQWVVAKRLPSSQTATRGSSQTATKSRAKRLPSKEIKKVIKKYSDASIADDVEIIPEPSEVKGKKVVHNDLGKEIIDAMSKTINPSCSRYYNNKTQRSACDGLIKTYGLEKVLNAIKILPQTNNEPFFPKIYTPLELYERYEKLRSSYKRKEVENIRKNPEVII